VKIGSASSDSLIATATAMRLGTSPEPLSAFELWRLADRKASEKRGDRRQTRLVLYRHALIHAGLIRTTRGTVYRRCAMCRERLER